MKLVPDLLSFFRYKTDPDNGANLNTSPDPYILFDQWIFEAILNDTPLPDYMHLKMEEDKEDPPDDRLVVIKGFHDGKFVFFTNYDCKKTDDGKNPFATMALFWKKISRRVKISGSVTPLRQEESEKFFNQKPFVSSFTSSLSMETDGTRIINSQNNTPVVVSAEEDTACWRGFSLSPKFVEFCHSRTMIFTCRIKYTARGNNTWNIKRLFPLPYYG